MNRDQIALQLYTVREFTAQDMLGTLRLLADQGYHALEFAGFGGVPAADLRSALDSMGLRAIGAHMGLPLLESQLDRTLAELRTIGAEFAVLPMVPPELRRTRAQVEALAARLNEWGARCQAQGLRFAYHNHAFEFEPLDDGATMFEVLTAATDPALVALELDVYWVRRAGHDPAALIRQHGQRVALVHVKDMAADETQADMPIGEGILPWPEILAAGDEVGVAWYIVEQDHPRDALNDVHRSLYNLARMAEARS